MFFLQLTIVLQKKRMLSQEDIEKTKINDYVICNMNKVG
jgi:hypothetical protein